MKIFLGTYVKHCFKNQCAIKVSKFNTVFLGGECHVSQEMSGGMQQLV